MNATTERTVRTRRSGLDIIKRFVDVVTSAVLLLVSAPVQLIVAILVAINLGRPVFFAHTRPGRFGRPFTLLKFRSMRDVDEVRGHVTNEQRLTAFGRALRASSFDELPSLINVLRGDMSLVGPRPLRMDYLPRYSTRQARRHEVRPGVTGLAQVSGRNAIGWDEKLELDVQYVERRSLRLDVAILVRTAARVFARSGITGDGLGATSAFMGNADSSGLTEVPLAEEWLETRLAWLADKRVSSGVSLSFVPDLETTRNWFLAVALDRSRRDWVYLTDGGQPVAMVGLTGVGTPDASLYLYVNPDLHGQGFGRRSLEKLIIRAESLGVRRLHLEVKQSNVAAIKLYERAGFAPDVNAVVPGGKLAYIMSLPRA
ncbi:MAG: GNAT family N-acetyltransferase [Microbacterium gubbeenense]|uniref:GNAT family N-acetyltransferase n=1 Tax=Microbacterium gubbeenense TaxID=159896 RepID=UPI003F9930BC